MILCLGVGLELHWMGATIRIASSDCVPLSTDFPKYVLHKNKAMYVVCITVKNKYEVLLDAYQKV